MDTDLVLIITVGLTFQFLFIIISSFDIKETELLIRGLAL